MSGGSSGHEVPPLALPAYSSLQPLPHSGYPNPPCPQPDGPSSHGYGTEAEGGDGGEVFDFEDIPPPYSPEVRGAFVAPPDYFSIFGQIREAREESGNHLAFLGRLGQIILNTIGCSVLLLVFMSIPITVLVLGAYFIGDCPAEPKIPVFLVVGGLSGALKNIILVVENLLKRCSHHIPVESARKLKYAKFVWRGFNVVFNLFLLSWIIAGSYWVYHIYTEVNPDYEDCHETLYKFAFGVITSSYILLVLMFTCTCCCSLCIAQSRMDGDREQQGGREGSRNGDLSSAHSDGSQENFSEEAVPIEGEDALGAASISQREGEGESLQEGGSLSGRSSGQSWGSEDNRGQSLADQQVDIGHSLTPSSSESHPELEPEPDLPGPLVMDSRPVPRGMRSSPGSRPSGMRSGPGSRPRRGRGSLEALEMVEFEHTPILSPRFRQLSADEQELPHSLRYTAV